MKECKKCSELKDLKDFPIRKRKNKKGEVISLYRNKCKRCTKEYYAKRYLENIDKDKANQKRWKENNKDRVKKINKKHSKTSKFKETLKRYRSTEKYKKTLKKRRKDPVYNMQKRFSNQLSKKINRKNFKTNKKNIEILGCSMEFFVKHIESKFKDGMSWDNKSEWHLDHIVPKSTATDMESFLKLNHYTNFQPLWAIDNIKKSNKIGK